MGKQVVPRCLERTSERSVYRLYSNCRRSQETAAIRRSAESNYRFEKAAAFDFVTNVNAGAWTQEV